MAAVQGVSEFKVEGIERLMQALTELPKRVQNKVLRKAVRKGATVLTRAMRQGAPKKGSTEDATGQLRRSIGSRMKTYRGTVVAIVGPRRGFREELTTPGGKKVIRDPVKYAHLYEFGSFRQAPHPFMTRAWNANRAQVSGIIKTELAMGIEREAAAVGKVPF